MIQKVGGRDGFSESNYESQNTGGTTPFAQPVFLGAHRASLLRFNCGEAAPSNRTATVKKGCPRNTRAARRGLNVASAKPGRRAGDFRVCVLTA